MLGRESVITGTGSGFAGTCRALRGADLLPPYVRLIHDVLPGDRSLFTRPDGLAALRNGRAAAVPAARRERGSLPRRLTSSHRGLGCQASGRWRRGS